jgi:hypothetical protein
LKYIIAIGLLSLIGCSAPTQIIETRPEAMTFAVEPIKADQLPVRTENIDSAAYQQFVESMTDTSKIVVEAETDNGTVKTELTKGYDNKGKPVLKGKIEAKPDSVKVDVNKNNITLLPKEKSTWEEIKEVVIAIGVLLVIAGIVYIIIKRRK